MSKINTIKIQTEIIKALIKMKKVAYFEYEDGVWVTLDGYCAYLIPKLEFYVDMKTRTPMTGLKQNRDNFCYAEKAMCTGEMKQLEQFNIVKLNTADGKEHWLQEKYFKLCKSWSIYGDLFYGCNDGVPVVMCMRVNVK